MGYVFMAIFAGALAFKFFLGGGDSSSRSGVDRRKLRDEERAASKRRRSGGPNVASAKIDAKAKPTVKLLQVVAEGDDFFDPKFLRDSAQNVFEAVQDFIDRKLGADELERDIVGPCFDKLEDRLADKDDRIQRLKACELDRISLVHFAAAGEVKTHAFSALLTAQPERGKAWQEVWTFRRVGKRWKLAKMRFIEECDVLQEQNVLPSAVAAQLRKDPETRALMDHATSG